jgi:iduronate 2-sulfatase
MHLRPTNRSSSPWPCLAISLLLLVAPWACRGSAKPKDTRPNVLLVVLDDMSHRIGLYGYPARTPSLDRLSQRGRRFDRAYCQFPICNPSRTSFMTGWRPERTQVWGNLRNPAPYVKDAVPLQEHFAHNGYFTARVGKIYHTPFEKEFRWDSAFEPEEMPHGSDESTELLWGAYPGREEELPDVQSVRHAEELLAGKRERPFFIALGLRLPHSPWWMPESYLRMYPPEVVLVPPKPRAPVPSDHTGGTIEVPPEREREAIAAYQAASTYSDALLGRVLQKLETLGLRESTIVVVLGDNGFHAGQHGLWGKSTLFEESARVPLLIVAPGVRQPGMATTALVELVDLYPTLVDLCGLPPVAGLDGKSLRPLLEDPKASVKDAAFTIKKVGAAWKALLGISARSDRYRYTLWPDGSEELYDEASDPEELTNVARDPALKTVRAELRRRVEALPRPAPGSAAARE